jgi:inositol transport system substrate-binding protein
LNVPKGIRDSLKAGGEKYKIVADQTGNWMRSEGMRIVESVLPSLPASAGDPLR